MGGIDAGFVVFALLVLGVGGIISGLVFPKIKQNAYPIVLLLAIIIFTLSVGSVMFVFHNQWLISLVLFIWGIAFTFVPLIIQTQVITESKDASDLAVAIFSADVNIGIGCGSMLGGLAIKQEWIGLSNLGFVSFFMGTIVVIFYMVYLLKSKKII